MSALPPKADIGTHSRDVRYVPKADIRPEFSGRNQISGIDSSARCARPVAKLGETVAAERNPPILMSAIRDVRF
jgi:hypothetical protein